MSESDVRTRRGGFSAPRGPQPPISNVAQIQIKKRKRVTLITGPRTTRDCGDEQTSCTRGIYAHSDKSRCVSHFNNTRNGAIPISWGAPDIGDERLPSINTRWTPTISPAELRASDNPTLCVSEAAGFGRRRPVIQSRFIECFRCSAEPKRLPSGLCAWQIFDGRWRAGEFGPVQFVSEYRCPA